MVSQRKSGRESGERMVGVPRRRWLDRARTGVKACRAALGLAVVALAACGGGDGSAPGNDSITESELRDDLFVLAHDSMGGRLTGTDDLDRASDWIRDRFDALGLEPAGDNGTYDQHFDLVWHSLGSPNRLTVDGAGGARSPGEGWTPLPGASGSASGGVVFAGYGIVEPRLDYDDYRGESVDGRIVLVLDGEPGANDPASPFDGVVTAEASRQWRKVLSAQERGAAAVLFLDDVDDGPDVTDWQRLHDGRWPAERRRIERFTLGAWAEQLEIPAAEISTELARVLVQGTDRSLEELALEAEAAGDTGAGVVELPEASVSFTTSVEPHVVEGRNVLAMIEGEHPELRDEVVIIGAHHDHNGVDGDTVYNGADDDGSGTVAVLEIAEAYARAAEEGERPDRSVIFALWDAEERGLLGAWYYTTRPLFPLERTTAYLNMDMIGRNEEVPEDGGGRFRGLPVQSAESNANAVNILGYSRAPELASVVEGANEATGLMLRFRYDNNASNLLRRSDHWPFLQNDVPAVWFHTGLHPDYHRPVDDPDRVEYEKMTRIVRLVHRTSWEVANGAERYGVEPMGSRPPS